jgi:SAM-dependent methyltransferase
MENLNKRQTTEQKNKSFFLDHHLDYKSKVAALETYRNIFREVSAAVDGADVLVDIGNGGVFDYDTTRVSRILAVDLMFTPDFNEPMPANAEAMLGSALDLPIADGQAGMALMTMLLHHLTGPDVEATRKNLTKAISEAARILRPGGKIVIMESCVPEWFFAFEKVIYKPASAVIEKTLDHPSTLQFPVAFIEQTLRSSFIDVTTRKVRKGAWVLQYGVLWPSILTPVQPFLFTAIKP